MTENWVNQVLRSLVSMSNEDFRTVWHRKNWYNSIKNKLVKKIGIIEYWQFFVYDFLVFYELKVLKLSVQKLAYIKLIKFTCFNCFLLLKSRIYKQ